MIQHKITQCLKNKRHNIGPQGIHKVMDQDGKGVHPKKGDHVMIVYKGWLTNGKCFDKNSRLQPLIFTVGDKKIIKGMSLAVKTMKITEKARFLIPSALAYKSAGKPPRIPAHADLVFALELLSFWPSVISLQTWIQWSDTVAYGKVADSFVCVKDGKVFVLDDSVSNLLQTIGRSPKQVQQVFQDLKISKHHWNKTQQWLTQLVNLQLLFVCVRSG